MGILINRAGWDSVQATMCADEIAERMGLPRNEVESVLAGETRPDVTFIAMSLHSFALSFTDLFRLRARY